MYIRKTTRISDEVSLVQEHGPGRYGAPGQKREKKKRETPEAVKEQNRKNRAERIQLAILGNFQHGHHVVLGYPKGEAPETYEQAEKYLRSFLEDIQRRCKAAGRQFKYIAATERGKRTAVLHHHMIIRDIDDFNLLALIEQRWRGQRVHSTAIYEDDTMGRQLADYIVKSIDKEGLPQGKYHISRNLTKPTITRELIHGRIEDPEPPAGYQVVPDTHYMGTNPWTGWTYQRYFLRSLDQKSKSRLPEWNQGLRGIENRKTFTEAARDILSTLKNTLLQNGNAACGIVDNPKPKRDKGKGHHSKNQKPAVQNGKAPCETVDNSVENNYVSTTHDSEEQKNDSQNGNRLLGIVDKLKARFGKGKRHGNQ